MKHRGEATSAVYKTREGLEREIARLNSKVLTLNNSQRSKSTLKSSGVADISDITESTRAEEALAQNGVRMERTLAEHEQVLEASERRYRRLFEAAKDGILILDADTGQIVDVNPFLMELTGYSHDDFLGKHLWEIGLFKDIASSLASYGALLAKKYVRYEDLPLEARDGQKIDVEFVSNVYRVDNQNVIQCNIRDITARKRAEKRILEQRATLNAILESAEFPIYSLDRDYRYTCFNRAHAVVMKALYGTDIQVGESPAKFQSVREDWQATRRNLERALQGETVTQSASSGDEGLSHRYFEIAHHPVRTDAGEVIGVSVFARDVTARKRAEDELQFRNLILSTQQEASSDGIHVVDVNGNTISSNRQFAYMWGIPLDIIESKSDERALQSVLDKLVNPGEFIRKVEHLYAAPCEKSLDEIALKDGRTFDRYSAPMLGADGKHFGRVWQFRDITARKRAEEERKQLEEQLRMSQKMEAIGSLAGGVAHDFNNLLSVILSYAGFVENGLREGDPVRGDLLEVKNAAERAVALTRQLLAFSRKQVLQPVPLNLNQIAAGVEKMLRRILGEDIDLALVLAPKLGLTLADPGQIEQVLMNLVVNARDAMPEGGKLTIETANVEIDEEYAARHVAVDPGSYVVLAVTDTGCGIDKQTKARLFEPFFTTKEKGKGTGLGLSTVYGIVKQSGGDVWVYSEPGRGTVFKVYLPQEFLATMATAIKPSTIPRRATGTETILVVEDELALRKVAKRILDAAGYTVLTAADGDEALRICAQHVGDFHLLLTDVVMPRMSGSLLAQELFKSWPTLEVLYMSGYTYNAIGQHGVLGAGTHFLAKPFTSTDLARKVREVLDGGIPKLTDGHEPAIKADAEIEEQRLDKRARRTLPISTTR